VSFSLSPLVSGVAVGLVAVSEKQFLMSDMMIEGWRTANEDTNWIVDGVDCVV